VRRRSVSLATLALLGVAPLLPAQQPQPIGRPTAEFEEPFSRVSGIRELADGRLIVSDQRDKIVQLIDFRSGAAQKISREGAGPSEYALPTALFAMPNNQTLLVDLQNRRFLMIGPDGKPGETISPPQLNPGGTGPGGRPMQFGGLVNPRGVDRQGRLYFQDLGIRMGGQSPDSVAILRWAPGATSVDTAGWVRGPQTQVSSTGGGGGGGMRITVGGQMVWSPVDAWGIADDGRVARLQPEPYRVVWYGAGRATPGPTMPYTPLRVTEADKAEYRATLSANPPTMIVMGGGGGGARPIAPQLPEPTFAEAKPPFSGNAAQVTPEGEVWVLRTRRAGDKIPVYDVFDASGRLARKVSLSAGSRVVGFGASSVYVVRTDEDDLEYLQRFARPVPGQP
jgi:hypothetical protein